MFFHEVFNLSEGGTPFKGWLEIIASTTLFIDPEHYIGIYYVVYIKIIYIYIY